MNERAKDKTKLVVLFEECEGQPPLLGDEIVHLEGQAEVCAKCPLSAGGLMVCRAVEVAVGVNSDPGSKDKGSQYKTLGGTPACFHPKRSTLAKTVGLVQA